jgi:hypothetical protein
MHSNHIGGIMKSSEYVVGVVMATLFSASSMLAAPADPDPTFGNDGIATTDLGPYVDQITALAVQPDGKILAGGITGTSNDE